MFLAIVLIAVGLAILLNTMGIMTGTFWGFFWGILFIAVGIKTMMRKDDCCGWGYWKNRMSKKAHDHCCDHDHPEHAHNH